jgi:hypothetical protein
MIHTVTATIVKKLKLLLLPEKHRIYVVLEGKLKGEWLVKVKQTEEEYTFFSLPDKYVHTIKVKDFDFGIKNKIIEPVDVLPERVYNVCLAEYNYKATDVQQNNTPNRRKQHASSDPLDSE